jgi:hypothetical protein
LGDGIRSEIIPHQVGPLIVNDVQAFQSSIEKSLMLIHVLEIDARKFTAGVSSWAKTSD